MSSDSSLAARLSLNLRSGVISQNDAGQSRHLLRDQVESAAARDQACVEAGIVGGQRVGQESAVQRQLDDLAAQFVSAAQRHIGRGHLDQVGDVLLEVFQGLFERERDQAAQAGAVFDRSAFGLVKDLDFDMGTLVDQRRKTDQHLAGFVDFHQLRQLAESPAGVALGRRDWRSRHCRLAHSTRCRGRSRRSDDRRWRAAAQLQGRQRLKSRSSLAAKLGLERGQMPAHAKLAAVLVDDAEVHEQVRLQHVELEVIALHGNLRALAHGLEQHVHQRALRE